MPRDSAETETDLDRLLSRLATLPRNNKLERARADHEAAIQAVDVAQKVFTESCQRLHKAGAGKLDYMASRAEAALIAAQVAHRATVTALQEAREGQAPIVQRHVYVATEDIRKALTEALATVERIAGTLCVVGQSVERDGGSLPTLFRGAYACRAMVRHVAGLIKS